MPTVTHQGPYEGLTFSFIRDRVVIPEGAETARDTAILQVNWIADGTRQVSQVEIPLEMVDPLTYAISLAQQHYAMQHDTAPVTVQPHATPRRTGEAYDAEEEV